MSSAKKSSERLCSKCIRKSDCEYKLSESSLVLLRCVDFAAEENSEEKGK